MLPAITSMSRYRRPPMTCWERFANTRGVLLIATCTLAACANPLNQATSDRYSADCASAEKHGNLSVAEEACYRAAVNVDWGKLGPEQKSEKLYNLARIKRQTGRLNEAEALLKESLEIEESLSEPTSQGGIGVRFALLQYSTGGNPCRCWRCETPRKVPDTHIPPSIQYRKPDTHGCLSSRSSEVSIPAYNFFHR
jgi:hypothetical protein